MEFHQPPTYQQVWRLTLPIRHTEISMHIGEKMRYMVSIDYIIAVWQPWVSKKKMLEKNHRWGGVATIPSSEDEV